MIGVRHLSGYDAPLELDHPAGVGFDGFKDFYLPPPPGLSGLGFVPGSVLG